MASYRYERDIDPKDLTPRKKRAYTRKERWANWWDYNLKWVIILGIAAAFVGYCFIGQYFLTTHADYNVAVVAPHYLPEATQTALQDALAAYGEDRNGDGKVVVKLNVYTMNFGSDDSDAYLDMAGTTKLSTDIQGALSSIFILYDPAGFQSTTGIPMTIAGRKSPIVSSRTREIPTPGKTNSNKISMYNIIISPLFATVPRMRSERTLPAMYNTPILAYTRIHKRTVNGFACA